MASCPKYFEVSPLAREPHLYNITTVAENIVSSGIPREEGGISWEQDVIVARVFDASNDDEPDKTLTDGSGEPAEFQSVTGYISYACPIGSNDLARARQIAQHRIETATPLLLEQAFWSFANANAQLVVTGAADVTAAVAQLGEHQDFRAVVHFPALHGEMYFADAGFTGRPSGSGDSVRLPLTGRGDQVVVSSTAYDSDDGIISTGPVGVFAGEVNLIEADVLIAQSNTRVILAERAIAIQVDPDSIYRATLSS